MRLFHSHEEAQGLMEYALLLSLVAMAVIVVLGVFGTQVESLYELVTAMQP